MLRFGLKGQGGSIVAAWAVMLVSAAAIIDGGALRAAESHRVALDVVFCETDGPAAARIAFARREGEDARPGTPACEGFSRSFLEVMAARLTPYEPVETVSVRRIGPLGRRIQIVTGVTEDDPRTLGALRRALAEHAHLRLIVIARKDDRELTLPPAMGRGLRAALDQARPAVNLRAALMAPLEDGLTLEVDWHQRRYTVCTRELDDRPPKCREGFLTPPHVLDLMSPGL
jgi:hypothetical protein